MMARISLTEISPRRTAAARDAVERATAANARPLVSVGSIIAVSFPTISTLFEVICSFARRIASRVKSEVQALPPMTLGNAAAARVRLIVWCKECQSGSV